MVHQPPTKNSKDLLLRPVIPLLVFHVDLLLGVVDPDGDTDGGARDVSCFISLCWLYEDNYTGCHKKKKDHDTTNNISPSTVSLQLVSPSQPFTASVLHLTTQGWSTPTQTLHTLYRIILIIRDATNKSRGFAEYQEKNFYRRRDSLWETNFCQNLNSTTTQLNLNLTYPWLG